jgi:hypothetical protein
LPAASRNSVSDRTAPTSHRTAISNGDSVHNWRVTRLSGLGIPGSLAGIYADSLDWHQIAHLVRHGCPPLLARRIIR